MKASFKIFLFVFLIFGVFGAAEDEVKGVSVMEGDFVTLILDLSQIQGITLIEWRFRNESTAFAKIEGNKSSYPYNGRFRDRVQLNQTGFLTIRNMRTEDSGRYEAEIEHNGPTKYMKFIVTVSEALCDIVAKKAETKTVSVTEGDPVTLQTDTVLHGDELILWKFGDDGKLIAKQDGKNKSSPCVPDKRFRERLMVDHLTGSLNITNSRTTDTGLYTVKISSNKQTSYMKFIVTVSGSGLPLWIKIFVVVLSAAVAAALCILFYYCCRNVKEEKPSLTEGDTVNLFTDFTEIQEDDEIQWCYGDEDKPIAEIKERKCETHAGADERFSGKLELDPYTGDLTVRDIWTAHFGLYTLKIKSRNWLKNIIRSIYRAKYQKRFNVIINRAVECLRAEYGGSVMLKIEEQTADKMKWMFGKEEIPLTEIQNERVMTETDDNRFRSRLSVDQNGSLVISDIRYEHGGTYKLLIIRDNKTTVKKFIVEIYVKEVSVNFGDPVTLDPGTKIEEIAGIQWMIIGIENISVANFDKEQKTFFEYGQKLDVNEETGPMKLDEKTGKLTIKSFTNNDKGLYQVKITTNNKPTNKEAVIYRRFNVKVIRVKRLTEKLGGSVKLQTEVETADKIKWMFGKEEMLLVNIKKGTLVMKTTDESFRDRLTLDRTGSLTISDISRKNIGLYTLQIIKDSERTEKLFYVDVSAKSKSGGKASGNEPNKPTAGNRVNDSTTVEMKQPEEVQESTSLL